MPAAAYCMCCCWWDLTTALQFLRMHRCDLDPRRMPWLFLFGADGGAIQPSQIDSSMATAVRSSSRLLAALVCSALLLLILPAPRPASADATMYPADAPTRASRRPRCTPWLFLF